MQTSADIGELAKALAAAQAEMGGAIKDSANPFFKSKYADLASVRDACLKPLTKHGIAIVQSPEITVDPVQGLLVTVETRLIHASGQWLSGSVSCSPKDSGPQAIGSAVTYLRRYALQSFAGVAPEDDDGEAAQGRPQAHPAQHQPQVAPTTAGTTNAARGGYKAPPAGFNEWLADLEATADEGAPKLKTAWNGSRPELKNYLVNTNPTLWKAIQAKAEAMQQVAF